MALHKKDDKSYIIKIITNFASNITDSYRKNFGLDMLNENKSK